MKFTTTAAVAAASLLLAATPAFAQTAPAAGPILIDTSQVAQLTVTSAPNNAGGYVNVSFTNENAVPATDITFVVADQNGNALQTIEDVGNYRQGVTVRHSFGTTLQGDDLHVAVAHVTFADGSTWSR
jgi:hypothetical protein